MMHLRRFGILRAWIKGSGQRSIAPAVNDAAGVTEDIRAIEAVLDQGEAAHQGWMRRSV
jgi:hypothetical protein